MKRRDLTDREVALIGFIIWTVLVITAIDPGFWWGLAVKAIHLLAGL